MQTSNTHQPIQPLQPQTTWNGYSWQKEVQATQFMLSMSHLSFYKVAVQLPVNLATCMRGGSLASHIIISLEEETILVHMQHILQSL